MGSHKNIIKMMYYTLHFLRFLNIVFMGWLWSTRTETCCYWIKHSSVGLNDITVRYWTKWLVNLLSTDWLIRGTVLFTSRILEVIWMFLYTPWLNSFVCTIFYARHSRWGRLNNETWLVSSCWYARLRQELENMKFHESRLTRFCYKLVYITYCSQQIGSNWNVFLNMLTIESDL